MTKFGHFITNLSVGVSTAALFSPVLFLGILAGSSLPDTLEISIRTKQGYTRLIPHRTITHWPPFWLIPMIFILGLTDTSSNGILFVLGLMSGALLHLACDYMTPMGIPLGSPFGERKTLNIFKTGGLFEYKILASVFLVALAIQYLISLF